MKKQFLILSMLFLFLSCKKVSQEFSRINQIEIGELIKQYLETENIQFDGNITITSDKLGAKANPSSIPTIMVDAKLLSNKTDKSSSNFGNLVIDDIDIPFRVSPTAPGYNLQSLLTSDFTTQKLIGLFGRRVKIDIPKSSTSGVFTTLGNQKSSSTDNGFYIPSQIEMDPGPRNDFSLPRGENITIKWNPDPQNPSQTIFLGIIDENTIDPIISENLKELIFFKEIPDNGSFSLPSNILSQLSINNRVTLFIARGNFEIYSDASTSSNILVQALTTSVLPYVAIQ